MVSNTEAFSFMSLDEANSLLAFDSAGGLLESGVTVVKRDPSRNAAFSAAKLEHLEMGKIGNSR